MAGAHFLVADAEASAVKTTEQKVRTEQNRIPRWVILLEGWGDAKKVRRALPRRGLGSGAGRAWRGAGRLWALSVADHARQDGGRLRLDRTILKNRIAIVTGGAGGIGIGIARHMLDAGGTVELWDRDAAALAQAAQSLASDRISRAASASRMRTQWQSRDASRGNTDASTSWSTTPASWAK